MTVYRPGMKTDCTEDGIWLDFRENTWLFIIRDSAWMQEELENAETSRICMTYIQKGIVDAFLVEIYDCLETSDVPFCMKDADELLLKSLNKKKEYGWEVVFTDGSNKVLKVRSGMFSAKNSAVLRQKLSARLAETYASEDFDKAYAKLVSRFEPFELEPFAVFTEKSGGRHE